MTIHRYLLREIAIPAAAALGLLLVLYVSFSLTRYLTDAVDGLIPPIAISQLTALKALIALDVLLPLSLYLGILLGLGRLQSDGEVTALRASGVSDLSLLWPILGLALQLAVLVGLLSGLIRPWAYEGIDRIHRMAAATAALDQVREGRFYVSSEPDRALFIDRIAADRTSLTGVFVRTRQGEDIEVIAAPTGTLHPFVTPTTHLLSLRDAQIIERSATQPDLFGSFARFEMPFSVAIPDPGPVRVKAMPGPTLFRQAQATGAAAALARAELQWRLAAPLITLLLALLAVPLSRSAPRRGRIAGTLLALVLYVVYYNSIGIAQSRVEQQALHNLLWVVLTPLPVIAALLLRRVHR